MTTISSLYIHNAYYAAKKWKLLSNAESSINCRLPPIRIDRIGIVDGGYGGISQSVAFLCAIKGYDVMVVRQNEISKSACEDQLKKLIDDELKSGKITENDRQSVLKKLTYTVDLIQLANCDMIIETIEEELDLKKELFAKLDKICPDNVIFVTSTSFFDVNEISKSTSRIDKIIGINFLTPDYRNQAVEVIPAQNTSGQTVASVFSVLKKIKDCAVLIQDNRQGSIINRLLLIFIDQILKLMLHSRMFPEDIDRLFIAFGMQRGPMKLIDVLGIDTVQIGRKVRGFGANPILRWLTDADSCGRKMNRGFYQYHPETGEASRNEALHEWLQQQMANNHADDTILFLPELINDQEKLNFVLFPMVREGYRCVDDEKIIASEAQIDLLFARGVDWPVLIGGPMRWAQTIGKRKIIDESDIFARVLEM